MNKVIFIILSACFLHFACIKQVSPLIKTLKTNSMNDTVKKYGIEGQQAPELDVARWVDGTGSPIEPVKLEDYKGKFKVIYCFQAWCPGCHSRGLPALQEMTKALKDNNKVTFMAIQTVFEGKHANTYERMLEIQQQYDLKIPFGHDEGNEATKNSSSTMHHYRSGGTPWFIFIDQDGTVVFNDFHLDTEKAIEFLKTIK